MSRRYLINLLLPILFGWVHVYAQTQQLNTDRQRLLLQLSSTFYHVVRQNQVDLDSALVSASHSLNISRLALIDLNEGELIADAPKTDGNNNVFQYLYKLLNQSKGTKHVRLLNIIGALFVFQPGNRPGDLDSAGFYLQKGQREALAAGDSNELCMNLCYLGKYYFEKGASQTADSCFKMAVTYCKKNGKNLNEARAWDFWALYSSYPLTKRINYCENALKLYKQLNKTEAEINVLTNLSYLQFAASRIGKSMTAIREAFELEKMINFPYVHYTTDMMSLIYSHQNDPANHLNYALQSIRSVEATKDSFAYAQFCSRVGEAYEHMEGKLNESLEWYLKSLNEYKKKADQQMYTELLNVNGLMIALGKDREAVTLAQSLLKQYPPDNPGDKQNLFLALGDGYRSLKENALAEKYYWEAENLKKDVERLFGDKWSKTMYYKIGFYYFSRKQFEKSKGYFMKVLGDTALSDLVVDNIAEIHKALYSIDSAAGRNAEASEHLKKYTVLMDSIYSENQSKQIEQLKIQYETEKKDNDIKFLKQQEEIQQSQLTQTRLTKNIVIASIIVLALLLASLYSRYRIKQRSNKQLETKQHEINQKNSELENLIKDKDELIADKDVLLKEKEWLIKEIHHRVKNKLQMVISLLNTQSKYLDNKEAIAAIGESMHRMQAMSLIHQKHYQVGNTAIVNMQNYIRELTGYLRTSFNTNKRIYFDLQVKDIELDIAQAIPIGLILNETITNAIKYAFRFIENGMISVIMKNYNDNTMLLEISDNGPGLPDDFDIATINSMGMRLIKGLVKQIDGTMLIENIQGLKIRIEFQADTHLKSISREEILKETGVFSRNVGAV